MSSFRKIKSDDIKTLMGKIDKKVDPDKWFRTETNIVTPNQKLYGELGPLTNAMLLGQTIDTAVELVFIVDYVDFTKYLTDISSAILQNITTSKNAYGDSLSILSNNTVSLRDAVNEAVGSIPKEAYSDSALLNVLDVLIIDTVKTIPVVGPIVGGVLTGFGAVVSVGLGELGDIVLNKLGVDDGKIKFGYDAITNKEMNKELSKQTLTSKDKNDALSQMMKSDDKDHWYGKGWGDDIVESMVNSKGPTALTYQLIQRRRRRSRDEKVGKLSADQGAIDNASDFMGKTVVSTQNPITQNQVATNSVATGLATTTPKVATAASELVRGVTTEKKAIKDFYKKVPEIFESYKTLITCVANSSAIASFDRMIKDFESKLAIKGQSYANNISDVTGNDRKGLIVALIVFAYYLNEYRQRNPQITWLDDLSKTNQHSGGVRDEFMGTLSRNVLTKRRQSFVDMEATLGSNMWAWRKGDLDGWVKKLVDSGAWHGIRTASTTYVGTLKSAIVNDLLGNLENSKDNLSGIPDMVKLVIACTLIINQISARVGMGKDIEIDDRFISILEACGYLNRYTKIGSLDDDKKNKLTGSGVASKLRYPKSHAFSRAASAAERSMVLMFASFVVAYVDMGKIMMGYQDWKKTNEGLHTIIGIINEARLQTS